MIIEIIGLILLGIITLILINCARGLQTLIAEHRETHSEIQSGLIEIINTLYKDPADRKKVNDVYANLSENLDKISEKKEIETED